MEVLKWDFKADGYHPHEPGLRKKLANLGYEKVVLREVRSGAEIASKNVQGESQALAMIAGRVFFQFNQKTEAVHQGDIIVIPPGSDYRLKASGGVATKILLGKKSAEAETGKEGEKIAPLRDGV